MKISHNIKVCTLFMAALLIMVGCETKDILEFGNDGAFAGTLKDPDGQVVPGTSTSGNLMIRALGQGDQVTTDIRVLGDGSYQNTRLFPKPYKVWVEGPVTMVSDTLFVDFSKERQAIRDIVVRPFISIEKPEVVGSPTSSSIELNYSLAPNDGKTVSKSEVYCSTVPYPTASIGSGPYYNTVTVNLGTSTNGSVTVEGLEPQTKYFIRIGSQASGASGPNYSEQIVVTTP